MIFKNKTKMRKSKGSSGQVGLHNIFSIVGKLQIEIRNAANISNCS